MDKKKLIKKVLLEETSQESLMNWVGGPLPSEYGGIPITNIVKIVTVPKPEELTPSPNTKEFCTKLLEQPDNKFKNLDECIRVQLIATVQQMQAGGVRSFDWSGQSFSACLRRNYEKKMSYFSGYYGTLQGGNCYAPEWYNMLEVGKKKNKTGVGGTGSISLTIAGPDYK